MLTFIDEMVDVTVDTYIYETVRKKHEVDEETIIRKSARPALAAV